LFDILVLFLLFSAGLDLLHLMVSLRSVVQEFTCFHGLVLAEGLILTLESIQLRWVYDVLLLAVTVG